MVSGTAINNATALPVPGAQVSILSTPLSPTTTDANGMYQFPSVPEDTYYVQAALPGFQPGSQLITVAQDLVVNLGLNPIDACNRVPGNLVTNCGFETGDFTAWTQSGDLNDVGVLSDPVFVHSGNFGVNAGPIPDLGFIAQNVTTTPGASYSVCYWLANAFGQPPDHFQVSWNGTVILDQVVLDEFGYSQNCLAVVATSDSTELKFGFQTWGWFAFDDVSVAPQ
jgi:hypothetical protein